MKNKKNFWKKITGYYKGELNEINMVRQIRDSIIEECDGEHNEGRIKKLIMDYPFVDSIQIVNPSIGYRVAVKTSGGYEYTVWDENALRDINQLLYVGYLHKTVF